ncbi:fatty acid desaturase family protein [Devosia ginsengisoli]|uniref:fatty acid desaturase family protein n=1 Tax=Devosia ginsengisoli TaxID=400770 RepID=UPI0026ECA3D1|nr:fatty acid desaturase family protein [Devosia ginsengisoli]MCR6670704.1 fatty acid desaturase family protein [Devosia ginsengisoli]
MKPTARDYSLIGRNAELAVASGLAAAEWYQTDIPRSTIKALMKRSDGPAVRDTLIWFALLAGFGAGAWYFWPSAWSIPFFLAYGVFYASAADSRWHECGHGTAFKTRWMNDVVYHMASFMILREPTIWRWSHTRHHTDTIIVGRDREIFGRRPIDFAKLILSIVPVWNVCKAVYNIASHATGRLTAEEKTFIPEMEWSKVYRDARIWLLIYAGIIALAVVLQSWMPVLLFGPVPKIYGHWLAYYLGVLQHAGLAEDVLDHRLNSRTVYMNPVLRFAYWNMNYHIEHHMFPMVPYHKLPELHEIMKADTPPPDKSTFHAYRDILPVLWRQSKDPDYFLIRELPPTAKPYRSDLHGGPVTVNVAQAS